MQLLIARKRSRICGGLTTQMGKSRHGQEKPKAQSQCWCLMDQHLAGGLASSLPCLWGVPKLWPGHPKVPDTLHLPELGLEQ